MACRYKIDTVPAASRSAKKRLDATYRCVCSGDDDNDDDDDDEEEEASAGEEEGGVGGG